MKPIDTSYTTYKADSVKFDKFKQSKVAMLPILAEKKYEKHRKDVETDVISYIKKEFPGLTLLNPKETSANLKALKQHDLMRVYGQMIRGFDSLAVPEPEVLKKLGKIIGCDYIMYSKIKQKASTEYVINGKPLKHFNPIEIEILTQIWDCKSGEIAWEGAGASSVVDDSKYSNIHNIINIASEGLSKRVGRGFEESPTPLTTQNLYNLSQTNKLNNRFTSGVIIGGLGVATILTIWLITHP